MCFSVEGQGAPTTSNELKCKEVSETIISYMSQQPPLRCRWKPSHICGSFQLHNNWLPFGYPFATLSYDIVAKELLDRFQLNHGGYLFHLDEASEIAQRKLHNTHATKLRFGLKHFRVHTWGQVYNESIMLLVSSSSPLQHHAAVISFYFVRFNEFIYQLVISFYLVWSIGLIASLWPTYVSR